MPKTAALQAHDWLSLVNLSGLLVSEPVLHEFFLEGPSPVESYSYRRLKREWERYQLKKEKNETQSQYNWLNFVLEEFLDTPREKWQRSTEISDKFSVNLLEYNQSIRPSRVLRDGNKDASFFVYVAPSHQRLDKPETETGRWRASPLTKFDRLLRDAKVPIGLLTNGEEFCLMYATAGLTTASITWNAQSWIDEKKTADAFFTLLNRDRFFGDAKKRLLSLVEESQKKQIDVTDQLGEQVLSALELFIRAIDSADKASDGELLKGVSEDELYEISLTAMMRLVFLLYAEENQLLPHGEMFYDNAYGITHLWFELQKQEKELLTQTYDAWDRLLATFSLIYAGCPHPDLNLKAYGGKLFDPKRFPVLEDERLRISNEIIYKIIRKLTFAKARIGRNSLPQRVSYRTLDIEQIGSVYESLMEYKTKRASDLLVVFRGKDQAIRPLSEFEQLKNEALVEYLKTVSGMYENKIRPYLEGVLQNEKVLIDLEENQVPLETELNRRLDKFKPFIGQVIHPGDLYITREGSIRKGSGSYYTPKQLTSFLVEQALEPLCYFGEGDTKRIKNPKEILSIKVCDPAMGSGAFLVQACRYLAERLIESWDLAQTAHPDTILTIPYAEPSRGDIDEQIMEEDREKQLVWAKRFVVENCLYGVDLNPLAVELAKMSLWLATLSKDRPFTFLDHRLRCGNSLIGAEFSRLASIPSEPLWKEDKKHNSDILKNHLSTISEISTPELVRNIIPKRNELAAHECRILDVKHKEELLSKMEEEGSSYSTLKKVCDLWCSVWFWPYDEKKDGGSKIAPPHTNIYRQILKYIATGDAGTLGEEECKIYIKLAQQVTEEQRFLHWELEFPEIFREADGDEKENSGFDVVIGNPPWDKVKPNALEFFSQYCPLFRALSPEEQIIKRDDFLRIIQISKAFESYIKANNDRMRFYDESMVYTHQKAKVYGKTESGDKNLYKLFIERFVQKCKNDGLISLVAPASITTDLGCTGLRRLFIYEGSFNGIYTFYKRAKAFPIDQAASLLAFKKTKKGNVMFTCSDQIGFDNPSNLASIAEELQKRKFKYPKVKVEFFKALSPELIVFQSINDERDRVILENIFQYPILRNWNTYPYLIQTTTDAHLTKVKKFIRKNNTGIPLWRGDHITNFKIRYYPEEWIDPKFKDMKSGHHAYPRLGWQHTSADQGIRRLSATFIPKNGALGNSIDYFDPTRTPFEILLYICAVLNSNIAEYRVRQTSKGSSVGQYVIKELPVPPLDTKCKLFKDIINRTERLIAYIYDANSAIAEDDFIRVWCELDALIAIAYNLSIAEFGFVLDSIPLPRRHEIAAPEIRKRVSIQVLEMSLRRALSDSSSSTRL